MNWWKIERRKGPRYVTIAGLDMGSVGGPIGANIRLIKVSDDRVDWSRNLRQLISHGENWCARSSNAARFSIKLIKVKPVQRLTDDDRVNARVSESRCLGRRNTIIDVWVLQCRSNLLSARVSCVYFGKMFRQTDAGLAIAAARIPNCIACYRLVGEQGK